MKKNAPAVSEHLYQTLHELKDLDILKSFYLIGGTNLALRFKHRISVDIDLSSEEEISKEDLKEIFEIVKSKYPEKEVTATIKDEKEVYYMSIEIFDENEKVKVDLIGDVPLLNPTEKVGGIPMASVEDIALLKLLAITDRTTQKDIYDLDAITDRIPLIKIYNLAKKKDKLLEHRGPGFFESGKSRSVVTTPEDLLTFLDYGLNDASNDDLDYIDNPKMWEDAVEGWTKKVHELYKQIGFDYKTYSFINDDGGPKK